MPYASPSTPPERAVLLVAVAVFAFGNGLVCLGVRCFAPPDNPTTAADLLRAGELSLAFGVLLAVILWVIRRLQS